MVVSESVSNSFLITGAIVVASKSLLAASVVIGLLCVGCIPGAAKVFGKQSVVAQAPHDGSRDRSFSQECKVRNPKTNTAYLTYRGVAVFIDDNIDFADIKAQTGVNTIF